MQTKDIMTQNIISVSPDNKVAEVAEILFQHGFHGLPVVENGKIVGIITENDFFIKDHGITFLPSYLSCLNEEGAADSASIEKKKELMNLEARDIMTKDVVTVSLDMEVSDLLEFIKKTRFNTLPVVDEYKNILGVVTLVDVIGMVKQSRDMDNSFKPHDVGDLVHNKEKRGKHKGILIISAVFIVGIIIGIILAIITIPRG